MKMVAAAAIALLSASMLSATPALAIEYQTPVTRQLYTCSGGGLSRVAVALPAPCCEGQLKCPQLLSTQGLLRARRDPRT